jgi:hypothetical protein
MIFAPWICLVSVPMGDLISRTRRARRDALLAAIRPRAVQRILAAVRIRMIVRAMMVMHMTRRVRDGDSAVAAAVA